MVVVHITTGAYAKKAHPHMRSLKNLILLDRNNMPVWSPPLHAAPTLWRHSLRRHTKAMPPQAGWRRPPLVSGPGVPVAAILACLPPSCCAAAAVACAPGGSALELLLAQAFRGLAVHSQGARHLPSGPAAPKAVAALLCMRIITSPPLGVGCTLGSSGIRALLARAHKTCMRRTASIPLKTGADGVVQADAGQADR